jgi:hypothetical protein
VRTFIVSLVASVPSSASLVASIPSSTSPLPISFPLVRLPPFSLSRSHTLAATSSRTFSCSCSPTSPRTPTTLSRTTSRQLRRCGREPTRCRQLVRGSGPHRCGRAPHGRARFRRGHPGRPPDDRAVCGHGYLSEPVAVGPVADADDMLTVSSPWTRHSSPANSTRTQPDSTRMRSAPQGSLQRACTSPCSSWPQRARHRRRRRGRRGGGPTHRGPARHTRAHRVRARHGRGRPLTRTPHSSCACSSCTRPAWEDSARRGWARACLSRPQLARCPRVDVPSSSRVTRSRGESPSCD